MTVPMPIFDPPTTLNQICLICWMCIAALGTSLFLRGSDGRSSRPLIERTLDREDGESSISATGWTVDLELVFSI